MADVEAEAIKHSAQNDRYRAELIELRGRLSMDVGDLIGYGGGAGQQRSARSASRGPGGSGGGIAIPGAAGSPATASSFSALYHAARGRTPGEGGGSSSSSPPESSPAPGLQGRLHSPSPPFPTPLASPLAHSLGIDVSLRQTAQQSQHSRVPPPSLASSLGSTANSGLPYSPFSPSSALDEESLDGASTPLSSSPRSRSNSMARVAESGQLHRARGASSSSGART